MSTKDRKKIAVLNWAGHNNLGDELFNDVYRQFFVDWEIHFFSNSNNASLPMIDFDVVNQCDLFALGGGDLINSDRLFIPSYWTSKIKAEIPKIILGCGVNIKKFSQLKLNVLQELNNFSYIGLRDLTSIKILSEDATLRNRIGLFYDLTFLLDISKVKQQEPKKRITVVIPTDRFTDKTDKGIQQYNIVKKSISELKNHISIFDKVVFLALGKEDNDDYKTCKELSKLISNESEIIMDCNLNKSLMLEAIAGASYVYTYRLHGLILAKIFGKPCGYYPYHWKLDRMANTLLGCNSQAIKVWQHECLTKVIKELKL